MMQVESMMGQFRNLVKQMSDDELHEAGIYLTQQLTKKEDFVEVNIFSIRNFSGQCRKHNKSSYTMISCHFPENVNIKLSTFFTMNCHFGKF